MAYDRDLAERIRAALSTQPVVREVSMFGGLSFMVNEKMTIGANTSGDLMVRCDPARVDALVDETPAQWAQMSGRTMSKGWLVVAADEVAEDADLDFWVEVALEFNAKVTGGKPAKKATAKKATAKKATAKKATAKSGRRSTGE
ncbi:TfoX/Sxy family protein [Micromonospora sp. WMMA1998]|uniref:TfoX/Sxy family protein n=1 Tax=Micromonospora sp. WMMA1998 TaxID=3015167 RepID=UPI00248C826F|nr:TfoX/Sxy family protein [Micromonospora sp. WMMA1998]WBC14954.1 TfoX/Sxy family protein [Micromonospora sp. WMMA1998]